MNLGLSGKVAVVTGGGGAICGAIARGLLGEGALVALWDLSAERAEAKANEIVADRSAAGDQATGAPVFAVACDATDRDSVRDATRQTLERFERIDILINGAGGSRRETTTSDELAFFDIDPEAMRGVLALNYLSAVIPSQEIGREFARQRNGVVLNIASIAGLSPLTRSITYSDGKAATVSFTKWLAVHLAHTYSPLIRVNAVAPGFILTDQNRFLLVGDDGAPTERNRTITGRVPMGRLGAPDEIVGAALWLVSEQATFVTGAVVPVDGGFTASSGV